MHFLTIRAEPGEYRGRVEGFEVDPAGGPEGERATWLASMFRSSIMAIALSGLLALLAMAGTAQAIPGQAPVQRVGNGTALAAPPRSPFTEFSAGISPGSYPTGIAAGPDGNLWFTEMTGNRIGRITPAGVVTEFSEGISPNSRPSDIAAGPDGNLWFTETWGNRIGRITPGGVVTEFSTGISPNSELQSIAAGPDGNMWFTEAAGRIGRITPAGVVTEFSAGISPGSSPQGIVAGPGGNMWFTETGTGRIGRITTQPTEGPCPAKELRTTEQSTAIACPQLPAGTVTEFATASPNPTPIGIAAGPDGNLWFAEENLEEPSSGPEIGRITPSGVVSEFSAGISLESAPQDITAAPDGNLWFTEFTGDQVARITTAGAVTEFQLPNTQSEPCGIVVGPDGNLWFTEASGNRIGRITP